MAVSRTLAVLLLAGLLALAAAQREPAAQAAAVPATPATVDSAEEATAEPAVEATAVPAAQATAVPAARTTAVPAADPIAEPAMETTAEPAAGPTAEPAADVTAEPAAEATAEPAADAAAEPAVEATAEPAADATAEPAVEATAEPAEPGAEVEEVAAPPPAVYSREAVDAFVKTLPRAEQTKPTTPCPGAEGLAASPAFQARFGSACDARRTTCADPASAQQCDCAVSELIIQAVDASRAVEGPLQALGEASADDFAALYHACAAAVAAAPGVARAYAAIQAECKGVDTECADDTVNAFLRASAANVTGEALNATAAGADAALLPRGNATAGDNETLMEEVVVVEEAPLAANASAAVPAAAPARSGAAGLLASPLALVASLALLCMV